MPLRLLFRQRFWPLFWTQFLGAFNDNFFKNALVILITFRAVHVAGIPQSRWWHSRRRSSCCRTCW